MPMNKTFGRAKLISKKAPSVWKASLLGLESEKLFCFNEYFHGIKRADILGLVRSAHLYYPECIKTPTSEKGNAVFKFDQLAPMNGIEHSNAHDAIGDVWATINIAKLISKKAPSVWKASLMTTSRTEESNSRK